MSHSPLQTKQQSSSLPRADNGPGGEEGTGEAGRGGPDKRRFGDGGEVGRRGLIGLPSTLCIGWKNPSGKATMFGLETVGWRGNGLGDFVCVEAGGDSTLRRLGELAPGIEGRGLPPLMA